ncbi:unnamed protein product [Lactuca saligna]|uniref:Uncharacterized protein n=1 Tax=Lactuca saligna TaxID=75948 RepID=A0AA36DZV4_LACSI|nr:unnamed protein product [Lactuca saligna]
MLDPYNQTDHPECKSRPDSGLSAITELDLGYITGPLSSIWKEWCIEFGIEANAILVVPYDWRLSTSKLEEWDLYFHKLKLTFETALKNVPLLPPSPVAVAFHIYVTIRILSGFEVLELIVDVENCLQAFFGVADDLDAIIIAFRTIP